VSATAPVDRTGILPLEGGHLSWTCAGSGAPIVLLHGFALDRRMWDEVAAVVAGERTVVTYDLRGFGASAPMDLHIGYTHTADLLRLLDHLGIGRAVVVGFSFGGEVAVRVAQEAPDRVRHLVLVDAVVEGMRWDAEAAQAMHAVRTALHDRGIEAAKQVWLQHPFFQVASRRPELAERLSEMVAGFGGRHWLGEDPHLPATPFPGGLGALAVPTTVVVGSLDVPGFLRMAEVLAREIPGAHLVTIPGSGHMAPMEAPEPVAEVLLAAG
jgi:2-succinyl-6-hydroxy-2,4-cyclohexadiene-1-carboxylate synthase